VCVCVFAPLNWFSAAATGAQVCVCVCVCMCVRVCPSVSVCGSGNSSRRY